MENVRVGDCNGCSLCCRTLVLPIPRADAVKRTSMGIQIPLPLVPHPDLLHFYRVRGLRVSPEAVDIPVPADASVNVSRRGRYLVAKVAHTCAQLTGEGQCRIHDTVDYPRACAAFPRAPEDLLDVADRCGYAFRDDTG